MMKKNTFRKSTQVFLNQRLQIPTTQRIAGIIVGLFMSGLCLMHLISDTTDERGPHDYVVGAVIVVGLCLSFPEQLPIAGIVAALRKNKEEE